MIPAVIGFVVGAVIGSFVQATAGRMVFGKSLRGRSYCLHCKKSLKWYDLFPIISYLLLQGKCRFCKSHIPKEDLIVEIIIGIAYALLFLSLLPGPELVFKSFVVLILALVFLIDLKSGLIPNVITYPASVVALIYLFAANTLSPSLGWAILTTLAITFSFILLIIVTRGRGMGWGDVKYVLFLGLALGFPFSLLGVLLAFFIGAVFSLGLIMLKRKTFGQTVPFGPFLSLGAFIALLWGPQIINWYISIF